MTSPAPSATALITGITGQDGSYLAELLLGKGYEVHGLVRRASTTSTDRIDHLRRAQGPGGRLHLHHGEVTDTSRLVSLLSTVAPDEVYHLAGPSQSSLSFSEPEHTGNATAMASLRLLEAIRMIGLDDVRYYQASSAEMFGSAPAPQHEDTPFHPRSPLATAKLHGYWATRNAREAFGMYAVNGILFNHESPRRGEAFVTRKIARAAARIAVGLEREVHLGNLDAVRDWGFAPEYVEGMWAMLQADRPDDYVLATGSAHSVEDFARLCFSHVGLDWTRHVRFDEALLRPVEADALVGDASKAARVLGWRARTHVPELVRIMVDAELSELLGPVHDIVPFPGHGWADRPIAG